MGRDVHDRSQHIQSFHGMQDFTAADSCLLLCIGVAKNSENENKCEQQTEYQIAANGKYSH
jgi:hypothetical protein